MEEGRTTEILKQYKFSVDIMRRLNLKKTEKGRLELLNSRSAFKQAIPDSETVFLKTYNVRRLKANDTCICGCPIGANYIRIKKTKFKCKVCKLIVSPLVDTPFQRMHFQLNRALDFVYWTYITKQGYATAKVARLLACKYKTALRIRHKITDWMGVVSSVSKFKDNAPIETDEVFPKIPSGLPKNVKKTRGTRSEGVKSVVVTAQRGGIVKGHVTEGLDSNVVREIIYETISPGHIIYTDGSPIYNFLKKDDNYIHGSCNHRHHQYANGDAHVNTAEGYNNILKSQIHHIHRGVSEEYLQNYVDDVAFAFSNRFKDLFEALDSLFNALPPLNFKFKKPYENISNN